MGLWGSVRPNYYMIIGHKRIRQSSRSQKPLQPAVFMSAKMCSPFSRLCGYLRDHTCTDATSDPGPGGRSEPFKLIDRFWWGIKRNTRTQGQSQTASLRLITNQIKLKPHQALWLQSEAKQTQPFWLSQMVMGGKLDVSYQRTVRANMDSSGKLNYTCMDYHDYLRKKTRGFRWRR